MLVVDRTINHVEQQIGVFAPCVEMLWRRLNITARYGSELHRCALAKFHCNRHPAATLLCDCASASSPFIGF